jgi:hypothetical protein
MYIADPLEIKAGFSKIKPPSPSPSDTTAAVEEEESDQ